MNQTPNIRREPQLPLPLASQSLTFNGVVLMPLSLGGQLWFRSSELARALGYKDENSVRRIYERNADEFTDDMTQVIGPSESASSPFAGATSSPCSHRRP